MNAELKPSGFTLSELLIALAILGVVATFTIPKVLQVQQYSRYNAMAKEVSSMVSGAYTSYALENAPSGSTKLAHLTPYMNYVAVQTSGMIDGHEQEGNINCSTSSCLKLHNGGILRYPTNISFSGTASTNAVAFNFDPDGQQDGNHSVQIWMYFNGRVTSLGTLLPNSTSSNYTAPAPCPSCDPEWLNWGR